MELRHYGWMALCAALGLAGCGNEAQAQDDPALEDAVAYAGRWATEPALCARGEEDRAITLGPSRFEGSETSCDMQVTEEGDNAWVADLDCPPDDMATDESIHFALEEENDEGEGEVLTLTYLDREDHEVTLMRCPGPGE